MKTDREIYIDIVVSTIGRVSGYSFTLKGWAITVFAALAGISAQAKDTHLMFYMILVSVLFWIVDSYYIMIERRFRHLFRQAFVNPQLVAADLSFDHRDIKQFVGLVDAFKSPTIAIFYGSICFISLALAFVK